MALSMLAWFSGNSNVDPDTLAPTEHYYLHWSETKVSSDIQSEFGSMTMDKNYKPERHPFEKDKELENWLDSITNSLQLLPQDRQNILVHIHGLWANKNPFFGEITSSLHQHVFAQESNPYGLVISIIWDAGFIYDQCRDVAYEKGKRSASIIKSIQQITNRTQSKLSILCHSMGNRVLHGIVDEYLNTESVWPIFNTCIMVAPDLESDIFSANNSFGQSEKIADQIIIYRHNTDRTLSMSRLINNDRLGLNGLSDLGDVKDNMRLIDVSLLNDEQFPSAKLSRHRYYYTSPTARKDVLQSLSNANLDRYQTLDAKNHFVLPFPE